VVADRDVVLSLSGRGWAGRSEHGIEMEAAYALLQSRRLFHPHAIFLLRAKHGWALAHADGCSSARSDHHYLAGRLDVSSKWLAVLMLNKKYYMLPILHSSNQPSHLRLEARAGALRK
jgi:hypothetical protein